KIVADKNTTIALNLSDFKKIYIIGVGKDSAMASISLAKILGKRLTKGIAIDVNIDQQPTTNNLQLLQGTHPVSSLKNIKATKKIISLAKKAGEDDLVVSFICGGGSALLCSSESELKASNTTFKELTNAGADIIELNTVRKHLSEVKGGGLARLIYPATAISLIVSDVLGNDISMVASGPTVYDKTTKKDAEFVLKKYGSKSTISGLKLLETENDEKYFKNTMNILFVSNKDSLLAMQEMALKLKLKPKIYSYKLKGEANQVFSKMVKGIKSGDVVLAGGESTVELNGKNKKLGKSLRQAHSKAIWQTHGKGGRNQEAVLGFLIKEQLTISNKRLAVISFASDGNDNKTEVAGAIGDTLTLEKVKKLKLNPQNYLDNHDSFNFFQKTKDAIYASKNNFNVADLMIVIKD
ncbi:hypothetical protein COV23_00790, partial [Candidatus Wolfebacteria bacterium CG10_big_fil_rev_8_21_14_0_10_31_9]